MLAATFISKIFLDAIGCFIVGTVFSFPLIWKRFEKIRTIVAFVPALIGSALLCYTGSLIVEAGQGVSLTLSLFSVPVVMHIDTMGAVYYILLGVILLATTLYVLAGARWMRKYKSTAYTGVLYNGFVLSVVLLMAVNDAMYFIVLWEMMILILCLLINLGKPTSELAESSRSYFIMMQAATFVLLGVCVVLSHAYGSTSFDVWRAGSSYIEAGTGDALFVLICICFGIASATMPFHIWLPRTQSAAPTFVSVLITGVTIPLALFLIVRFVCEFLPAPSFWWGIVLLLIGAASAILATLRTRVEGDLRSFLAFSTVGNVGIIYIVLGAMVIFRSFHSSQLAAVALAAVFFQLMNYSFFKSLLILSLGSITRSSGTTLRSPLHGSFGRLPYASAALFLATLAISAFPPLCGFAGLWFIFQILVVGMSAPVLSIKLLFLFAVVAVVITSGLTIASFIELFRSIGTESQRGVEKRHRESLFIKLSYGILAFMLLCFGIFASPVVAVLSGISQQMNAVLTNTQVQPLRVPMAELTPVLLSMIVGFAATTLLVKFILYRKPKQPIKNSLEKIQYVQRPTNTSAYLLYILAAIIILVLAMVL